MPLDLSGAPLAPSSTSPLWSGPRAARVPLSAAVILVLGGCGSDPTPPAEPTSELLEGGDHPVGYQQQTVTYEPRGSAEPRNLPLEIWHPATADGTVLTYAVAGVVSVPSERATDAPLDTTSGPYPVVVYSHGSGGAALLGYPYGEHLASHGFLVVAPDHVGNTGLDQAAGAGVSPVQSALDRPQDIGAVLDWLASPESGEIGERADPSRVLVIGHSFGGYAALAVAGAMATASGFAGDCPNPEDPGCALLADAEVQSAFAAGFSDPRVAAVVAQAPAVESFGDGELAGLDLPVMLHSGGLDQTTPRTTAEAAWTELDGPDDLWLDLPEGAHYSFVSVCYDLERAVIELFQPTAFMDGCGDGFLSAESAIPVLAAYVLGFARVHLLGEEQWGDELRGPPLGGGFEVMTR